MRKKIFFLMTTMVMVFAMAITAQACEHEDCNKEQAYLHTLRTTVDFNDAQTYFDLGYTVSFTLADTNSVYIVTPKGEHIDISDERLSETQVLWAKSVLEEVEVMLYAHPIIAPRGLCCGGVQGTLENRWVWGSDNCHRNFWCASLSMYHTYRFWFQCTWAHSHRMRNGRVEHSHCGLAPRIINSVRLP